MEGGKFLWPDYLVFSVILALSASIGLYHGIKGRKAQTIESYLMADRSMHPVPVALSMFVTYMSAISFLADPVEVYSHGAVYIFLGLGYMLAMPIYAHWFAPFYHSQKLTSAYEFLGTRYNKYVRLIGSLMNTSILLYSAIALYAPSLAFSQVTDMPLWAAVLMTGLVCTIYTTLGGMKAVLWADSAQFFVMLLGVIVLIIKGFLHMGGFSRVIDIAWEGGRLNFNKFDPNIFLRSTFWTCSIGGCFRVLVPLVSSQAFIQRVCTVSTKRDAKLVPYLNIPLFGGIVVTFCLIGLLLYAYFHDCDPYLTGRILRRDQMVPLMMTELLHFIPGLPGLFLACLYCAALSSLSSVQNGLATTIMVDMVDPCVKRFSGKPLNQRTATHFAQVICFIIGLVNIAMSIFIGQMQSSVFKMSVTMDALFTSPKAGVFMLGILAPVVDTVSALLGGACGVVVTLYLGLNMFIHPSPSQALPFSTEGCNQETINITSSINTTSSWVHYVSNSTSTDSHGSDVDYSAASLSPLLISPIGVFITCVMGLFIAYTRDFIRKKWPSRVSENQSVPEAHHMIKQNPAEEKVLQQQVQDEVPAKVQHVMA